MNAELEIVVTYDQSWWPFGSVVKRFAFATRRDAQYGVHWVPITPLEETPILPGCAEQKVKRCGVRRTAMNRPWDFISDRSEGILPALGILSGIIGLFALSRFPSRSALIMLFMFVAMVVYQSAYNKGFREGARHHEL
jgi:hypothetical protein